MDITNSMWILCAEVLPTVKCTGLQVSEIIPGSHNAPMDVRRVWKDVSDR